jgi:hypothetical protein
LQSLSTQVLLLLFLLPHFFMFLCCCFYDMPCVNIKSVVGLIKSGTSDLDLTGLISPLMVLPPVAHLASLLGLDFFTECTPL